MKPADYVYMSIICICVSVSVTVFYDVFILSPKLRDTSVKIVNIDHILSISEEAVENGELSISGYKKRINWLENAVTSTGTVLKSSVKINGETYPIAYGGKDMTKQFLDTMEAIE